MKKSTKVLHWLPRVIGILAILFVSMFALDAFSHGLTLWQQIGAFLMHLIPSFILLTVFIVAWKWELIGGIIFVVIALVMSPIVFMHNYGMNQSIGMSLAIILIINLPFAIVGALFILSHFRKKKESIKNV